MQRYCKVSAMQNESWKTLNYRMFIMTKSYSKLRQKVKADGTANILCRITVDGKSAAISTGISCTPQEWNAKKGEVRNARDNGRLAGFLAEVKDKYNSLLTANGIITVEMLKAVLTRMV